jgi:hypothetical protein
MNIWSTFRFVPPLAPEALAWATLSFATYLAASEATPVLWGRAIDPLALALAVQMTLSITKNILSDRFLKSFLRSPRIGLVLLAGVFAGLGMLAVYGTAVTAAKLFILYYLAHAAVLSFGATHAPGILDSVQGTWVRQTKHLKEAVMLEAAGLVIAAATLFSIWTFAGPLAFAAMMSFGVLLVRTMANWVIVLFLLDKDIGAGPHHGED